MTPSPSHHRARRRDSRPARDAHDTSERAEKRRRRSRSADAARRSSRSPARADHRRDDTTTHHSRRRSRSPSRTRHHKSRRRSRPRSRRRDDPAYKSRRRSHSRDAKRPRSRSPTKHKSRSRSPFQRSRKPLPSQELSFATTQDDAPLVPKQKANFAQSGLLAREANTVAGTDVVLKYHEPADAREPPASLDWRLYIFKGDEVLETIPLAQRSCWLFGRERAVVDVRLEHPSASKQHVVVQFRYVTKVNEFGDKTGKVKPYLIDLESANGTELNGEKIASRRFVEVRTGDVMRVGLSERDYVFVLPPKE